MDGPRVQQGTDLAKIYLRVTGKRRPVWPIALPKQLIGDFRRDSNLAPDRAVGRVTFEQFLRDRQNQDHKRSALGSRATLQKVEHNPDVVGASAPNNSPSAAH